MRLKKKNTLLYTMDELIKIGIRDINNPKLPKGWPKLKKSKYNNEKYFAVLTGEINDIVVIDLDVHDSTTKSVMWFEEHFGKLEEQETLVTKTKRDGYHIFYKYDKRITNKINFNDSNIDILTDGKCSYQGELYPVIVDKPIRELTEEEINLLTDNNSDKDYNFTEEEINDPNSITSDEMIIKMLNKLDKKRCDDYSFWIRIGFYLTKYTNGEFIFKNFSKNSDKFDPKRQEYDWSYIKNKHSDINLGTILFWLKEDLSEKDYNKIREELHILRESNEISKTEGINIEHTIIKKMNKNKIDMEIKNNNILNNIHNKENKKCKCVNIYSKLNNNGLRYMCSNCKWGYPDNYITYSDLHRTITNYFINISGGDGSGGGNVAAMDTLPIAKKIKDISDGILIYVEKIENKGLWYKYNENNGIYEHLLPIYVKNEVDKIVSKLEKSEENLWIKWLNKYSYSEQLLKELKRIFLVDMNFEFDKKEYLFGFKDGVLDLRDMSFDIGNKEDYTSMCCKYRFSEVIESGNLAEEMVRNMFLTEDDYNYTLKRLSNCLYGRNKEQTFTINYGFSASNGKSNLMERVKNALGDYGDVFQNKLITSKTNKANEANESLLDFNKKRFLYCSEPEADARLNVNFIKELTGDEIKVRGLYSRNITMKPSYNIFICCNRLPVLDSYDAGIARRIRIVEYPIHFTEKPKRKNEKQIRQYSEEEKEEIEKGLLKLIIEYHNKEIEEPENLKNIRKMYLNDNKGEIEETLKEMYEESEDKNDYIKLKDIKKDFREIDIISLKYIILSVFPKCEFYERRQTNKENKKNIFENLKKTIYQS